MTKKLYFLSLLLGLLLNHFIVDFTLTHTAFAQSAISSNNQEITALRNEVKRLKNDLINLQRQVYGGQALSNQNQGNAAQGNVIDEDQAALDNSTAGRLQLRIQQLEGEIRNFHGRLEEANFIINTLAEQLSALNQDLQFRLDRLEQGGASQEPDVNTISSTPNTAPKVRDTPANAQNSLGTITKDEAGNIIAAEANNNLNQGTTNIVEPTVNNPKQLYAAALQKLQTERDYEGAETLFREFLTKWPEDALAGNARYWVGETFYARGNFEAAVHEFINTYTEYKDSVKAPDALLKLALSLDQIDKKSTACEALNTLLQDYEQAPDYVTNNARATQKRLKCL